MFAAKGSRIHGELKALAIDNLYFRITIWFAFFGCGVDIKTSEYQAKIKIRKS